MMLVVAIAVQASSLQGYSVSIANQRRSSPRAAGLSFVRIGLQWLQLAGMAPTGWDGSNWMGWLQLDGMAPTGWDGSNWMGSRPTDL
jgi:hypothetical protein